MQRPPKWDRVFISAKKWDRVFISAKKWDWVLLGPKNGIGFCRGQKIRSGFVRAKEAMKPLARATAHVAKPCNKVLPGPTNIKNRTDVYTPVHTCLCTMSIYAHVWMWLYTCRVYTCSTCRLRFYGSGCSGAGHLNADNRRCRRHVCSCVHGHLYRRLYRISIGMCRGICIGMCSGMCLGMCTGVQAFV